MKKLLLILPILFVFLTCKEDPEPPPPPLTLDQRLIGGRWYFPSNYSNTNNASLKPKTADGYYKFTDDNKLIFSDETTYKTMVLDYGTIPEHNEFLSYSGNEVYSKDGVVYWKADNRKVMSYSFHTSFPYQDGTTGFASNDQRLTLNDVARHGDFITYRLYDVNGNPYGSNDFNYYFWR